MPFNGHSESDGPQGNLVDDGKQFFSILFKAEAHKHGIKLIFCRPYNSWDRVKIERYHQRLCREPMALKEFQLLSHFPNGALEFRPVL
jgi:transposase InsO family protein